MNVHCTLLTTYWYVLNSHARDDKKSQNTYDIAVDILVHARGQGTGCDKNPRYTHQDRLQYINDFVLLLQNITWIIKTIQNYNMLTHYVCMHWYFWSSYSVHSIVRLICKNKINPLNYEKVKILSFNYLIARDLNLQNEETKISLQKTHKMIDYAYSQIYCAPRHFRVEKTSVYLQLKSISWNPKLHGNFMTFWLSVRNQSYKQHSPYNVLKLWIF